MKTMLLLYMYQVFILLLGHLHFFFTCMENLFKKHPIISKFARKRLSYTACFMLSNKSKNTFFAFCSLVVFTGKNRFAWNQQNWRRMRKNWFLSKCKRIDYVIVISRFDLWKNCLQEVHFYQDFSYFVFDSWSSDEDVLNIRFLFVFKIRAWNLNVTISSTMSHLNNGQNHHFCMISTCVCLTDRRMDRQTNG